MEKPEQEKGPQPLFLISRTATLKEEQGLQINTSVYEGDSFARILYKIDLQDKLIERSRTAHEIPLLEKRIELMMAQLEDLHTQVNELLDKQKQGERLKTTEETSLHNANTTLKAQRRQIERGQEELKELRARHASLSNDIIHTVPPE